MAIVLGISNFDIYKLGRKLQIILLKERPSKHNIYSLTANISKSPLVKVYNVKFKTLLNTTDLSYIHK